jgi:hypothetical protein
MMVCQTRTQGTVLLLITLVLGILALPILAKAEAA